MSASDRCGAEGSRGGVNTPEDRISAGGGRTGGGGGGCCCCPGLQDGRKEDQRHCGLEHATGSKTAFPKLQNRKENSPISTLRQLSMQRTLLMIRRQTGRTRRSRRWLLLLLLLWGLLLLFGRWLRGWVPAIFARSGHGGRYSSRQVSKLNGGSYRLLGKQKPYGELWVGAGETRWWVRAMGRSVRASAR